MAQSTPGEQCKVVQSTGTEDEVLQLSEAIIRGIYHYGCGVEGGWWSLCSGGIPTKDKRKSGTSRDCGGQGVGDSCLRGRVTRKGSRWTFDRDSHGYAREFGRDLRPTVKRRRNKGHK